MYSTWVLYDSLRVANKTLIKIIANVTYMFVRSLWQFLMLGARNLQELHMWFAWTSRSPRTVNLKCVWIIYHIHIYSNEMHLQANCIRRTCIIAVKSRRIWIELPFHRKTSGFVAVNVSHELLANWWQNKVQKTDKRVQFLWDTLISSQTLASFATYIIL